MRLGWANPGDSSITHYQYQQKEADGPFGQWTDVPGSDATTTTHTAPGLTNGVTYAFRIRAVNQVGSSPVLRRG